MSSNQVLYILLQVSFCLFSSVQVFHLALLMLTLGLVLRREKDSVCSFAFCIGCTILFASYSQIEYFSITYLSYYQEKSVFAKCVRHCRSRDPEDSCGASDACSNYKSSKFTG
uniref:Uncharacterized protein n=1 Tax=Solanum tuberosum TaxID=4113 RepID=M1APD7_SOLTU